MRTEVRKILPLKWPRQYESACSRILCVSSCWQINQPSARQLAARASCRPLIGHLRPISRPSSISLLPRPFVISDSGARFMQINGRNKTKPSVSTFSLVSRADDRRSAIARRLSRRRRRRRELGFGGQESRHCCCPAGQ